MTWQQFLTVGILAESWHERDNSGNTEQPRCTCGVVNDSAFALNEDHIYKVRRTFTTEADMMACYRALVAARKWERFIDWIDATQDIPLENNGDGHAWLFCLSGEGYEERCKMVAEFAGWEG